MMENKINNKNWDSICLVGLGNHAKTKIIPALEKNFDKDKISIVTRKNLDEDQEIKKSLNLNYFKTLEESFEKTFIFCSNSYRFHQWIICIFKINSIVYFLIK